MPEPIIKIKQSENQPYIKPITIRLKIGLDKLIKTGYVEFISFQYSNNIVYSYVEIKGNDFNIIGEGKTITESIEDLNKKIMDLNLEL